MAYNFKRGLPEVANLELDVSNPIARGLDFLGVPRMDGRPVDLVRGLRLTRSEANRTSMGLAINGATATNAESSHLNYTAAPFTVWAYVYIANAPSDYFSLLGRTRYGSESDNEGYGLETLNNNTFRFQIFRDNNVGNYSLGGTGYSTGFYHVAGTTDGTTKRIYNQGVQSNSSSSGNLFPSSNTSGSLAFGGLLANNGNGTLVGGIWKRALSADEIWSLYQDPFQLVRLKRNYSRLWIAGVGSSAITGTSAVTAPAATLTASGTIVNAYTGTSAVTAAAATMAATGTVVNPATGGFGSNFQLLGIG